LVAFYLLVALRLVDYLRLDMNPKASIIKRRSPRLRRLQAISVDMTHREQQLLILVVASPKVNSQVECLLSWVLWRMYRSGLTLSLRLRNRNLCQPFTNTAFSLMNIRLVEYVLMSVVIAVWGYLIPASTKSGQTTHEWYGETRPQRSSIHIRPGCRQRG